MLTSLRSNRSCVRPFILAALLAAAGLAATTNAQVVVGEAWTPHSHILVVPQVRVIPARPSAQLAIIESVNANIEIIDQVAVTALEITLKNPSNSPMETEMLLPVPDGATVKGFVLDGLPNEGQARILPRDEARRIYESIVRQTRDPGLVEFFGTGALRTSVFPVPANGTQKLRITYEQVLKAAGNRVDYILPRSEALGRGGNWKATLTVRSSKGPISSIYSPTHSLQTKKLSANEYTSTISEASLQSPGSLRLSYMLPKSDAQATTTVFTYPDPTVNNGSGGYFLLLANVQPGTSVTNAKPAKRDLTIVVDRSGSMAGAKIEQARKAALQTVEGLAMGESFNIVDYSDSVRTFAPASVVKTPEVLEKARTYISGLNAVGGTNLHEALLESLRASPTTEGALPIVLFLTDGRPTVGITGEKEIRDAARTANKFNRRVFTFGVGFDVNGPLLSGISDTSRATSTFVLPDEDVEVKVGQVFRQLTGPVLAETRLTLKNSGDIGGPAIRDTLPSTLPDLFEDDQLIVVGQYTTDRPIDVVLSGTRAGENWSMPVVVDPSHASITSSFVPRLWAGRRIAWLTDSIRNLGAENPAAASSNDSRYKELVDEVVRLSTRWGILTEYTAFLAAETTDLAKKDEVQLRSYAREGLSTARSDRDGQTGVAKEINQNSAKFQQELSAQNCWVDGNMQMQRANSIANCSDQAMFRKKDRWVDARIYAAVQAKKLHESNVDRTITIGSDDYFGLCSRLEKEGRQSLLAQDGEVELLVDNQRVLIKPQ